MSQTADVPIPRGLTRRYSRTAGGRAWLESLPRLIGQCLIRWQLEPDLEPGALPWNGHGGIVLPVRRMHDGGGEPRGGGSSGGPVVLKLAYPHDEAVRERHALALWAGHGAVRLLAADPGSCAMLLERLDAAYSLSDVPVETAVPVWGGLVRRLGLVPDLAPGARPEWQEFEHVAARAEQWSDELPEAWEQLGRPFPRWLLESALEVCQTRGAVGRRAGKDVLVHTDLHYLNILARPGIAERAGLEPVSIEDFAAIDPQPMIGEAEFAVAPLLWNRIGSSRARIPRGPSWSAAGTSAPRQASMPKPPGSGPWHARWTMPSGTPRSRHHDGDLARSLWVASTLAGRTLPDLPAPHDLPGPGRPRRSGRAEQRQPQRGPRTPPPRRPKGAADLRRPAALPERLAWEPQPADTS